MKIILICIIALTLPTYSMAQFVLFAIGGIWECVNKPDLETSGVRQVESFPFWIKFYGDEVLITNSNNKRIYDMGMQWTYMKGAWQMKKDTLIIHINDTRHFSTNTGFYEDQFDEISMTKRFECRDYKFIVEQISENQIQLTPLNYFLGYSAGDSHSGYPYTFYLGEDEKLSLIKTFNTYHFNDKL